LHPDQAQSTLAAQAGARRTRGHSAAGDARNEEPFLKIILNGKQAFAAWAPARFDGERDSVVFVHGTGQDHSIWPLFIKHFSRTHNVLAPDLPGHGRSAGPALQSVEQMADWVAEAIQAAGLGSAAVIGHSLGSLIALDCAARHPDRVRAIALVGTAMPMRVNPALLDAALKDTAGAIAMMTKWSFARAADETHAALLAPMQKANSVLMSQSAPGVIHTDLNACNEYRHGLERAGQVRCPATLVLAEQDRMTPPDNATALGQAIPGARTCLVSGAGHAMLAEQPEQVTAILAQAL